MLTQIVVLYMAYTYNLPTWCKTLMVIAIVFNVITFVYKIYKLGESNGL